MTEVRFIDEDGEPYGIKQTKNEPHVRSIQQDSTGREVILGRTAFDELHVAELTPVVQLQFPYNINTDQVDVLVNNSGTITQSDNMAVLQSGTNSVARAELHSIVPIKYNPGQGGLVRFTTIYTPGVPDSSQYHGVGDIGDGYFFGYSGSTFGILKRRGGTPEIRALLITVASETAQDVTIVLDGDSDSTVTLTDQGADTASTRTLTANEIAVHDYKNVGSGWQAVAEGSTVVFISLDAVSHGGAYSITGTTVRGTFTQPVGGTAPTEQFIPQSEWGGDRLDGSGPLAKNPSEVTLDPTKGNVYQISYQWLGFGQISFFVENPSTGDFILVHRIEYANANILPSVNNPTLPLSAAVVNTGNTTNRTTKIGSMSGFIEGKDGDLGLIKATSVAQVAVAASIVPLISIRNKFAYQGKQNRVKVELNLLTVSNDAKDIIVRAILNPVLTGASFSDISTNTSVMTEDVTATVCSGGTELFTVALNKNKSEHYQMRTFDIELNPGNTITFAGVSEAAGTTVTVGINWKELF